MRLSELIDSAVDDPGVRLMVVADEVQREQLLPLRDSIGRGDGKIRLITIGHCKTPEPARIPALPIRSMDCGAASRVVKGWYSAMPPEHVDFVVRFADGYVRPARLAAYVIATDTSINVRELLDRDKIRGFLDSMFGGGDRRALHVVAVLGSVGWSEDEDIEGKAVANHLGLDWNDVRAEVEGRPSSARISPMTKHSWRASLALMVIGMMSQAHSFPNTCRGFAVVLYQPTGSNLPQRPRR